MCDLTLTSGRNPAESGRATNMASPNIEVKKYYRSLPSTTTMTMMMMMMMTLSPIPLPIFPLPVSEIGCKHSKWKSTFCVCGNNADDDDDDDDDMIVMMMMILSPIPLPIFPLPVSEIGCKHSKWKSPLVRLCFCAYSFTSFII